MEEPRVPSRTLVQIMSDLHLETPRFLPMYSEFQIETRADHLALLGDIGSVYDERLFDFLGRVLRQFKVVFYLLGNHEPYAADSGADAGHAPPTYQEAYLKMVNFEGQVETQRSNIRDGWPGFLGKFVFMNRMRWDINDHTTILGCTLFSRVTPDQEGAVSLFISDFSNISNWTVQSHNDAHAADLEWLNDQVAEISRSEPDRRITILTHHSPTLHARANNPDHIEDPKGVLSAFVTDLSSQLCWTSASVTHWAFGHTHWNCDFVDEDTGKRVVANQRGYGREDIFDFDPNKVIELE